MWSSDRNKELTYTPPSDKHSRTATDNDHLYLAIPLLLQQNKQHVGSYTSSWLL